MGDATDPQVERARKDAELLVPFFAALARGWPRSIWHTGSLWGRDKLHSGEENEAAASLGERFGRRGKAFHTTCAHRLAHYDVAYFLAYDAGDDPELDARPSVPFLVDLQRWRLVGELEFMNELPPEDDFWAFPDRNDLAPIGAYLDRHFEYRAGWLALTADRFARRREGKKSPPGFTRQVSLHESDEKAPYDWE